MNQLSIEFVPLSAAEIDPLVRAAVAALNPRVEGERMATHSLAAAEEKGFDSAGAARFIHGWLVRNGATSGEELVKQAKTHGYRGRDDRCFGGVFIGLVNKNLIRCLRSDLPRARGHGTSGGKLWSATV